MSLRKYVTGVCGLFVTNLWQNLGNGSSVAPEYLHSEKWLALSVSS